MCSGARRSRSSRLGDEGEAANLINPAALLAEAAVRFAMEQA